MLTRIPRLFRCAFFFIYFLFVFELRIAKFAATSYRYEIARINADGLPANRRLYTGSNY